MSTEYEVDALTIKPCAGSLFYFILYCDASVQMLAALTLSTNHKCISTINVRIVVHVHI